MSRKFPRFRVFMLVAALGLMALGASQWQRQANSQEKAPAVKPAPVHQAEQLSAAFRHASEVAMPSVVTVHSKVKAHTVKNLKGNPHAKRGDNPFKGTPFEGVPFEFFGGDGMPSPHSRAQEGVGSGVIVDSSGIILTNNHVVDGADEVLIELADGREFKATDVKTDPSSDMAVLRIKGAGSLPAATLGDSDEMQIGDWVLAIGNPFELEQTVSAGIISGKGRELDTTRASDTRRNVMLMLQTDAAINPGNSGGPLVNLEGEVIGINTAIATKSGGFQGIGFVIPSNRAKWVMSQLIDKGSVERAYLGVAPRDVTQTIAAHIDHAKRGEGALIEDVTPDSPAAAAGLEAGDIITEVGGHKVHSPAELRELVERSPVGSHLKLAVLRDGEMISIDVVPKALPKDLLTRKARPDATGEDEETQQGYENESLGIEVGEMTSKAAHELGMTKPEGVLITNVDPNGVAAQNGLVPGVAILSVRKHPVKSVDEFRDAVKKESLDKGIMLWVRSKTGHHLVVLEQSADEAQDAAE